MHSLAWRALIEGLNVRYPTRTEKDIEACAYIAYFRNGSEIPDTAAAIRHLEFPPRLPVRSPDKCDPVWHQLIADLKARFPDHPEEAIEDKAYIAFSRQGSNYRLPYKESFQWRSLIKGLRERLPGYSEDAIEDKASIAFYRNGSLTPDIERAVRLLNIKTLPETKQVEGHLVYYPQDSPTSSPDSTSDATGEGLIRPSDGEAG